MSLFSPQKSKPKWRWPQLDSRVTINGRTGSGKTVSGLWLLSNADFDKQPFVVIDYKRDKTIGQIARIEKIGLDEVPDYPGLYHLQPMPHEDAEVESWLWKVWHHEKIGLFIDEGFLIPDGKAFKSLLVTGRSKLIPIYTLSQRPVKVNRFVFTEADFLQTFRLNDKDDRERIKELTPTPIDGETSIWDPKAQPLEKYHSKWYDVVADVSLILAPAPRIEHILQRFDDRLTPKRRII